MAGEAQIVASGRSADSSPRRHRDHRDEPEFADEHGFDFILCALCASVVRNSDLNYAKQSQFAGAPITANCCGGRGLREKRADRASAKTKPIFGGPGASLGPALLGLARGLLGDKAGSRTPDDSVRLSLAKPGPDATMNRLRVRRRRIRADYPIWSSN
jgi:hypothetical protein